MKSYKSERGFTLVDISIALIIILLAMSFISFLFFNITKSSKEIERESQATYIATTVIEAYKKLDYDAQELQVGTYTINNGYPIGDEYIFVNDGYSVNVTIRTYVPDGVVPTSVDEIDILKVVKVTVSYKLANEVINKEFETSITR